MDLSNDQPKSKPALGTWNPRFSGPGMDQILTPTPDSRSLVNDTKIRRLYLQAISQHWTGLDRVDFSHTLTLDEKEREAWTKITQIFYTLEQMGLNVINLMTPHAVRKMKSNETSYYLAVQAADEARHVFLLENYLKKLGVCPKYDRSLQAFGRVSSMGLCRVENWLFSTVFSENFASAYLQRAKRLAPDPIGTAIYKNLLIDESRHLHFLHIVLPDLYERMGFFQRGYLKISQGFIMRFTRYMARTVEKHTSYVGIDQRELMEDVFTRVERAYSGFGVNPRFLPFAKINSLPA